MIEGESIQCVKIGKAERTKKKLFCSYFPLRNILDVIFLNLNLDIASIFKYIF